jgi:hypothetical protein
LPVQLGNVYPPTVPFYFHSTQGLRDLAVLWRIYYTRGGCWWGGRGGERQLSAYVLIYTNPPVILLLLFPTRIHTFSPTPTSLWSCLFASLVENPPPPSLSLLSGSFPFHLMMFYAKALACNDFIPRIVRTTGEQGKMCRFTSRISDGIHGLHTCARSALCSPIIASRRPYTS